MYIDSNAVVSTIQIKSHTLTVSGRFKWVAFCVGDGINLLFDLLKDCHFAVNFRAGLLSLSHSTNMTEKGVTYIY